MCTLGKTFFFQYYVNFFNNINNKQKLNRREKNFSPELFNRTGNIFITIHFKSNVNKYH